MWSLKFIIFITVKSIFEIKLFVLAGRDRYGPEWYNQALEVGNRRKSKTSALHDMYNATVPLSHVEANFSKGFHSSLAPHSLEEMDLQSQNIQRKTSNAKRRASVRTALFPQNWVLLGPLSHREDEGNSLAVFGGIQKAARNIPVPLFDGDTQNDDQLLSKLKSLPQFPSEGGGEGHTTWCLGTSRGTDTVQIDLRQGCGGGPGWAIGDFHVNKDSTILMRCSEEFSVDDSPVLWTSDLYDEHNAVEAFSLSAGHHRIFVRYKGLPFMCNIFMDSADARSIITDTKEGQSSMSPLVAMKGAKMSEIVNGRLASPYVGIPILNAAPEAVLIRSADIVDGPPGVLIKSLTTLSQVPIQSKQVYNAGLILKQGSQLKCLQESSESASKSFSLSLTFRLHPVGISGSKYEPLKVTISRACVPFRTGGYPVGAEAGGYIVAFPDFDNSIQHMWVAPPNVNTLPSHRCPKDGCPVMMSTHGANVPVGPAWGRCYSTAKYHEFPYPAWLVQPSGRYHWGTDHEGVGLDNAIAAVNYVKHSLPGTPKEDQHSLQVDADTWFNTGHSMGGHGCMLNSVHDPDRTWAALCAAGWTSMDRPSSKLAHPLSEGLLLSSTAEHAVDFLAVNLQGLPMQLIYGRDDDNVPPRESKYLARLVDSWNKQSGSDQVVELVELEGTPHWFDQYNPKMVEFYNRNLDSLMRSEPQRAPLPERFQFVVPNPSTFGSKGNLKLLQLIDPARPGKVVVQRCTANMPASPPCSAVPEGDGKSNGNQDPLWIIHLSNVRRFKFRHPAAKGMIVPLAVEVDGTRFTGEALDGANGQHFCQTPRGSEDVSPVWHTCGGSADGRLWESVQRGGTLAAGGPFNMVLRRSPLCIVHGSGHYQEEQALYIAEKLHLVSGYVIPIMHADATQAHSFCQDANLILLGSPSDNTWLFRSRCAFPYIQFSKAAGFAIKGKMYQSPNIGLLAVGRLSNGRQALLVSGTDVAGMQQAVKRVPSHPRFAGADFMVLGAEAGWEGNGGILAAGYLDGLWQPSATSWADPTYVNTVEEGSHYDCSEEKSVLQRSEAEILQLLEHPSQRVTERRLNKDTKTSILQASTLWILAGAAIIIFAALTYSFARKYQLS